MTVDELHSEFKDVRADMETLRLEVKALDEQLRAEIAPKARPPAATSSSCPSRGGTN